MAYFRDSHRRGHFGAHSCQSHISSTEAPATDNDKCKVKVLKSLRDFSSHVANASRKQKYSNTFLFKEHKVFSISSHGPVLDTRTKWVSPVTQAISHDRINKERM